MSQTLKFIYLDDEFIITLLSFQSDDILIRVHKSRLSFVGLLGDVEIVEWFNSCEFSRLE